MDSKAKKDGRIVGGLESRLRLFLFWPMLLGILLAAAAGIMFYLDKRAGIIMLIVLGVYLAAAFAAGIYLKSWVMDTAVTFATSFSRVQQRLIRDMEIPFLLVDESGKIIWKNKRGEGLFGEPAGVSNISQAIPEIKPANIKAQKRSGLHIKYGERHYQVYITKVDMDEESQPVGTTIPGLSGHEGYTIYAISMFDDTEAMQMRSEIGGQKLVCGIIYVDNYDEVLSSTDEASRSLLSALVERKITKYLQDFDAIVDKLDKDKYVFYLKQKYLSRLQASRFSVLDDAREINIGNELSVTLSIGLGVNADSYAQSVEWARHAIDLALGRGGDQAVIKDRDKMSYYGGKTRQVEKSTRVRARVKAHALRQVILGKRRVVVMGHKIGDVDCVGAGIGVYRAARALGKDAHIVLSDISPSVKLVIDSFLGNPEYNSDMFVKPEEAVRLVNEDTALIVVDVNTAERTEAPALFGLTRTVVVIDHHRQSGHSIENPVLSYIEPYASSACEMVTEILQYITDGIKLRPDEADALYAGIIIDTNNFLNETGSRTFEAAAFLRRSGADVTRVRHKLRDDMNTFKARAKAVSEAVIDGPYAYAICPSEGLSTPSVVGAQVANELLNIKGIVASFVFTKVKDTVFVSARSLDTMNVQLIMEKLGGGGHTTIAGAQIAGSKEIEVMETVREIIREMKKKGEL